MDRVLNKQALMGVDEAKRIVAAQYRPERPQRVPLEEAVGLVLAEDVRSPGDFPPFRQSNVDGYAFAYDDWCHSGELEVQREVVEAGIEECPVLHRGSAIRIFTGAPVPADADSVVMQEKVTVEQGRLRMDGQWGERGANIRAVGSDIGNGQQALSRGTRLLGPGIGLLASLGISEVSVVRRPAVSIILTGSELAVSGSPLRFGQVYESNGTMLRSLLHGLPVTLLEVIRVPDDEQQIREALSRGLEAADVVLLTGGASVGDYDFVARAASACGVHSLFHGVRQKPGKPLYYGRKGEIDVFGLPGNPSSVLTCFYVYVLPALCTWAGDGGMPRVERYRLTHTYRKPAELTVILKAQVQGRDVTLLDKQASYQLAAFGQANGLAVVPEGVSEIRKGDGIDVIWITDRTD